MKTKLIRRKETIPKKTIKMLENFNNIARTMLFLSQHCQYQFDEKKREEILEDIMKLNEEIDHLVSSNWHCTFNKSTPGSRCGGMGRRLEQVER